MGGTRVGRFKIGVSIAFTMLMAMSFPAAAAAPAASARPGVVVVGGGSSTDSWIVTLKAGSDARTTAAPLAKAAGGGSGLIFRNALHGFVFHGSAKAVAALAKNPNVRTIVADQKVKIADEPIPTGISRIRANHLTEPSAYGSGFTGKGVKVAILDTGVDLTHPDLVANLNIGLGRNCITAGPPQDGHGHGTHVAGIVAAAANGFGVIGVAPEATIVPIKVLDDTGQGEWSNLICAVDYLTGLMTDSDPTNDVRVANMSLGDVGHDRDLHRRRHPRSHLPLDRGRRRLHRRGRQLDGRRLDVHPSGVPGGHRRLGADRPGRGAGRARRAAGCSSSTATTRWPSSATSGPRST